MERQGGAVCSLRGGKSPRAPGRGRGRVPPASRTFWRVQEVGGTAPDLEGGSTGLADSVLDGGWGKE